MNFKQFATVSLLGVLAGAGLVLLFSSWSNKWHSPAPVYIPGKVHVIQQKDTTVGIVERVINNTQLLKPEVVIISTETVRLTDSIFLTPPGHIPASLRRIERAGERLAIVYCQDTMDSAGIVWSQLREYRFKVSPYNDYIISLDAAESLNLKTWSPLRWGFGLGVEGGFRVPPEGPFEPWKGYYTPLAQIWLEKGAWRISCDATNEGAKVNLIWRINR